VQRFFQTAWERVALGSLAMLCVTVITVASIIQVPRVPPVLAWNARQAATAGCQGANLQPGGPDPWGGCFPGEWNTGVPTGTSLTAYGGSCTITADNTTIDAKTIDCPFPDGLVIAADNVTITRSFIDGFVFLDEEAETGNEPFDGTHHVTITDSTIDAGADAGTTGLGGRDYTALRVEIINGGRSAYCWLNCSITDSYLHGQIDDVAGEHHESALRQGAYGTFTHNTIHCTAPENPPEGGCSADMSGYGDFATIEHNTIDNNLFGSNADMGFCAYGGSSASKPFPNAHHIKFRNNILRRDVLNELGQPDCALFGPVTDFDTGAAGSEFSNNRYHDGTLIPAA
jgi:hypothetical protein